MAAAAQQAAVTLSPEAALGVIAFLLSLLPAGFFIWFWYLRRKEHTTKASLIGWAFLAGIILVLPAFWFEDAAETFWETISPTTAHYFGGAVPPLRSLTDILLPAVGTFMVVATVEEGLRYVLLRIWVKRSHAIDQVLDGLLVGVALGLGFATMENTLYFLNLFRSGSYDTLVFVFFLRFMISTLAHISFAGLMGTLIARGVFNIYNPRRYYWMAFLIPWFLHGLYDLLLGITFSFYAVLVLIPALFIFVLWTRRREFVEVYRKDGQLLAAPEPPRTEEMALARQILSSQESPWNKEAPWLSHSRTLSRLFATIKRNEP